MKEDKYKFTSHDRNDKKQLPHHVPSLIERMKPYVQAQGDAWRKIGILIDNAKNKGK